MAMPPRQLDIQGHRGARGLMPENTLPAFARALEIGVTTLELDCGVTLDGAVVVSHDSALNPDITRGPDGLWLDRSGALISTLTRAQLRDYDVGRIRPDSDYARRFPRQQAVDGTAIPCLADVFGLAEQRGGHTVRFNIETKISPLAPEATTAPEAFTAAIVHLIQTHNLTGRVTLQSFDWRTLLIAQQACPEIKTVYLSAQQPELDTISATASASPWNGGLHVSAFGGSIPRMVRAAGGAAWSPYHTEVTHALLDEAHAQGLKVVVWTVNEPAAMRRMIELGVDGIITDYPDVLRDVAAAQGLALPPRPSTHQGPDQPTKPPASPPP